MAMEKAKELVSSYPVVVFSKSYCPFCRDVKKLLDQLQATYKAVELDSESDGSEIQSALASFSGQRTVPNVFIGGKHIGGCDVTHNCKQIFQASSPKLNQVKDHNSHVT